MTEEKGNKMHGQLRIEEIFAFTVVDTDGTEGVPAFKSGEHILPMMGADSARIEDLRPMAQQWANRNGLPMTLVRFTTREEVEVIQPEDLRDFYREDA
jgi:hypothetical protein